MRGDAVRRFLCNWKVLPCWDGTGEGTPRVTGGTLEPHDALLWGSRWWGLE